jgi:hypothetical protein
LDQPIVLTDRDLSSLVISVVNVSGQVTGVVRDGRRVPVEDAQVVMFPADYRAWIEHGMSTRPTREVHTPRSGAFAFTSLAAGDYLLAAFADGDGRDWPDPRFVAAAALSATRVHLEAGGTATVDLGPSRLR